MDIVDLSRMFFSLLAVVAMIGLCAFAAKKSGLASGNLALGRKRRLEVVETIALDARRRAAILRCDSREHLVILGAASELLVDADLPAPEPAGAAETAPVTAPSFSAALRWGQKAPVAADAA
jgi:flagellar protein FliO/FliZ